MENAMVWIASKQIVCCANYAPSNAGLIRWFADIVIALLLVALAAAGRAKAKGKEGTAP